MVFPYESMDYGVDGGEASNIAELQDVELTNLANGEILKYNSSSEKWENQDNTDTLNELTDVNLFLLANNFVLKYDTTSSEWYGNYINLTELGDTNISNLNSGDILRYNGIKFANFSPTYLDGAGINDNFLIKVVNGATTQTSFIETSVANTSTSLKTYIPLTPPSSVLAGSIETEIFNTTKQRMHLTTGGIASTNGITITSDGKVGVGVVEPEEELEVDGSIQIDSANIARLKFQQSGQNPHALAEIDGEQDGTNGGDLQFYTKVDGGSVTEKLRINNVGAIGIVGANYGTSGQVIVSRGSGNPVEWADKTDTTYSGGTGVTINGSNQISIGQPVANSDSPSFNQLTLGNAGVNQGILNLQDLTNIGNDTIAQMKGLKQGTNGGDLQFYTKVDGGSLTERMTIHQNGLVAIKTDFVGLLIATADGVTEQGNIYNSGFGTKDFVIEAAVGSNASKSIAFRIAGNDKLKIGSNGEIGIGGANYGSAGQAIVSNGSGSAVTWGTPTTEHVSAYLNNNFAGNANGSPKLLNNFSTWTNNINGWSNNGTFTVPSSGNYRITLVMCILQTFNQSGTTPHAVCGALVTNQFSGGNETIIHKASQSMEEVPSTSGGATFKRIQVPLNFIYNFTTNNVVRFYGDLPSQYYQIVGSNVGMPTGLLLSGYNNSSASSSNYFETNITIEKM